MLTRTPPTTLTLALTLALALTLTTTDPLQQLHLDQNHSPIPPTKILAIRYIGLRQPWMYANRLSCGSINWFPSNYLIRHESSMVQKDQWREVFPLEDIHAKRD